MSYIDFLSCWSNWISPCSLKGGWGNKCQVPFTLVYRRLETLGKFPLYEPPGWSPSPICLHDGIVLHHSDDINLGWKTAQMPACGYKFPYKGPLLFPNCSEPGQFSCLLQQWGLGELLLGHPTLESSPLESQLCWEAGGFPLDSLPWTSIAKTMQIAPQFFFFQQAPSEYK